MRGQVTDHAVPTRGTGERAMHEDDGRGRAEAGSVCAEAPPTMPPAAIKVSVIIRLDMLFAAMSVAILDVVAMRARDHPPVLPETALLLNRTIARRNSLASAA